MSGTKNATSGSQRGRNRAHAPGDIRANTAGAWERFVTGEDVADAVRPEILASWLRCRDQYKVDPWRQQAPTASDDQSPHALGDDVVLAELGGVAKSMAATAEDWGGLATVADGRGRVLVTWGNKRALLRRQK